MAEKTQQNIIDTMALLKQLSETVSVLEIELEKQVERVKQLESALAQLSVDLGLLADVFLRLDEDGVGLPGYVLVLSDKYKKRP